MKVIRTTGRFERDVKLAKRRGKDLDRLWTVVEVLQLDGSLEPRHRPHRLSGEWRGAWECHVEPDWLLIWRSDGGDLILTRTGTHADLFE